jgi:TonB family protein
VIELNPKPEETPRKLWQRRQLWLALGLLFVALVGLVIREREFWFGPETDSDVVGPEIAKPKDKPSASAVPDKAADKTKPLTPGNKQAAVAKPGAKEEAQPQPSESAAVAERTAVPPLDVEVVSGDKHSTVHPGTNAANVVIANGQPAPAAAPATNAVERAPLSTTVPLSGTLGVGDGAYPTLAQQSKVQASVVLQALIGADGLIQNLRVLTGPPILSNAAQEAVRPWHFKPYLQNGQPVETKAKITVNFVIRVADTSVSGS